MRTNLGVHSFYDMCYVLLTSSDDFLSLRTRSLMGTPRLMCALDIYFMQGRCFSSISVYCSQVEEAHHLHRQAHTDVLFACRQETFQLQLHVGMSSAGLALPPGLIRSQNALCVARPSQDQT